jgi:hypothetical protein
LQFGRSDKIFADLSPIIPITHNQDKFMKTLTCDLCDHEAQGKTFEEWMEALKPHYGQAHADVMKNSGNTKEEMENWMAVNRARFDAA